MTHEGTHSSEPGLTHRTKSKTNKLNGRWVWIGIVIIILIVLVCSFAFRGTSSRSETYHKASGAAGLEATISYDCNNCKDKFGFNVYILRADGQQVGVVRPDKDGKVNMAMAEGDYVLLIGKQFGKDKLFPQENVKLKNGQKLELKLHYKE